MHYILPDEAYDALQRYTKTDSRYFPDPKNSLLNNYSEIFDKDSLDWYKKNFNQLEKEYEWFLSITRKDNTDKVSIFKKNTLPKKYSEFIDAAYQEVFSERDKIVEKLKNFYFDAADLLYKKHEKKVDKIWYEEEKKKYQKDYFKKKQEAEEFKRMIKLKKKQEEKERKIDNMLNQSFINSDKEYKKLCSQPEYEKLKAKYIQKYFEEEFVKKGVIDNAPDSEQAEAIGALGNKVLVSARAGSGKTQTISGKVALLMNKYGVKKKEILVLCFNRSAAKNMKERIENFMQKGEEFNNAKTFHSWAWSIVNPKNGSVLFDDNREFSEKQFSSFVKKLIDTELKNTDFQLKIYNFFRDEYEKLDENLSEQKYFKNKEDRYLYLRNETESTLSGVFVKSRGEKWISDFLFEHDIKSYYEQQLSWEKLGENKSYHPDFTIQYRGEKFILEHWGIDEYDLKKEVPEFWTKTWEEYKKEMNDKREYFSKNYKYKDKFIETSIRDINYSLDIQSQRKSFEEILKKRLEAKGVVCEKIPKAELIKKVQETVLFNRFNTLVSQFIGWMQNLEWTKEDIKNKLSKGVWNEKQKVFCELGLLIYEKYKQALEGQIDFNILIAKATEKIKNNDFDVSGFKYILIDEFQDFSELFQNLINSIQEKNSAVNLFCVGDSWQLINGFAGSDEKFFKNFKEKAHEKCITTCYRSDPEIIKNGNKFAEKYSDTFRGEKSKLFQKEVGEIEKIDIQSVKIKNDKVDKNQDDEFKECFRTEKNNSKEKFLAKGNYVKARYLKKCFQIIKENPNKSILILSRNNKLKGIDLSDFFTKESSFLKKLLRGQQVNIPKAIKAMTMHKSKGLEADIVILLDITEKKIPSIHPSNELFEIFGRTPEKILDEEKRLFYVALTRAKEKLFILTEKGNESEFLSAL